MNIVVTLTVTFTPGVTERQGRALAALVEGRVADTCRWLKEIEALETTVAWMPAGSVAAGKGEA